MKRILPVLGVSLLLVVAALAALRAALLAPALPVPEPRDWRFRDVTLVEPGRPPRPGRTLAVRDRRLSETVAPGAATAPDLDGLEVLPGLIDLHVHYPPRVALGNQELWSLLFLAHGVTTVRETGSIDGSIFDVRRRIEAGETPGPRIFACGEILDGSPPSFPSNRVVTTPEAAREAVREQAAAGADCIKTYNMLDAAVHAAIVAEARALGLPAIGHVPHDVAFEDAGLADVQHGTGVVQVDRARVGRNDFRWEDWESVDDARIAWAAQVSRRQDVAHTPTIANPRLRNLLVDRAAAERAWRQDTGLRHLPRLWDGVWHALWGRPFTPGDARAEAENARLRARQARMAARLHAAGVRVHAGTDTLMPYVAPGSSLHAELAELGAAGVPEPDLLALATREAGAALAHDGLGTLAPGAPADLLFLRPGAPDTPLLGRLEAVLAEGRLYRRADLDAALRRYDAHFHGRLYETVMNGVVRVVQRRFRR